MALSTAQALQFFYAQLVPRGLETPLFLLLLYGTYLLIAAGILLLSLRVAGAHMSYADLPKGVFTIVLRDLLVLPLLALVLFLPIIGIVISFAIWLGVLRYIFSITWFQAFLAWLASGIIHIVLIVLVIIPALLLL